MKTLCLCMLLFINTGIVLTKTGSRPNKKTAHAATLTVNAAQSVLSWHVTKLTGEHTGTLKLYWGRLTVQNSRLTGGSFIIDMTTLDVTDLTGPDKQKLEINLKGSNFFETGRFTVAKFDITDIKYPAGLDISRAAISGNLTMRGITKKVSFNAAILQHRSAGFIAQADFNINRRDWNIATVNFKYNHFISPVIALHILIKAS